MGNTNQLYRIGKMKCKSHWKPFLTQFKNEVNDKAAEVDPTNEYCWLSLTIGWAIAKGFVPEDASNFAIYVRYDSGMNF